jgi:hypothetical protein
VSRYFGVYVKAKEILRGVKFAFKVCANVLFNLLNGFFVPCDQGIIDVKEDKAGAVFIQVSVKARFIWARV